MCGVALQVLTGSLRQTNLKTRFQRAQLQQRVSNPFWTVFDNHELAAVFALCAGSALLGGTNSFDIGHVDRRKVRGTLHYVPMVEGEDYVVGSPNTVQWEQHPQTCNNRLGNILVDSGSSNCLFSDAVFSKLVQTAARENPGYSELFASPTLHGRGQLPVWFGCAAIDITGFSRRATGSLYC